jgi:hypothetical protein
MEERECGDYESAPLDESLVALIEQALSNVHPNARGYCDVDTIHQAFRTLGCFSVADIQLFLASDLLIMQAQLAPTPLTFLMQLKQCAAAAQPQPSPSHASSSTPSSAAFRTPTNESSGHTPALLPTSVITSAKVGAKTCVDSCMINVSAATTFANLLAAAIAQKAVEERTELAALPCRVFAYTSKEHLSSQRVNVNLAACM